MGSTLVEQEIATRSGPTGKIKKMAGRSEGIDIVGIVATLFETTVQNDTIRS